MDLSTEFAFSGNDTLRMSTSSLSGFTDQMTVDFMPDMNISETFYGTQDEPTVFSDASPSSHTDDQTASLPIDHVQEHQTMQYYDYNYQPPVTTSVTPLRRRGRPRKTTTSLSTLPKATSHRSMSQRSEDSDDETEPSSYDKNLKNREAAQQFRQRQREHIRELEQQVATYQAQNESFNEQVEKLQDENKLARQQVQLLREFIAQAMSFAFSNLSNTIVQQQLQQMQSQIGQLPAVQAKIEQIRQAVSVAQN